MELTSKGLRKPSENEIYDVDNYYNPNMDRLNQFGMGAHICTSTTRPTGTNRWDGQIIRETDTGLTLIYHQSEDKWRYLAGQAVLVFNSAPNVGTPNGTAWGWTAGASVAAEGTTYASSRNAAFVGSRTNAAAESITIADSGVFAITAVAHMTGGFANGVRAFVDVGLQTPSLTLARASYGPGEDRMTATAVHYLDAGSVIIPSTWQNTGGSKTRESAHLSIARIA